VLDGVDRNPVVQDSLQEGVFAQFAGELYWYWATADDLAYLTGVGMAKPPGEQVTDNDQVSSRRTSRAFARSHRREGIGGVGIKAFAFLAGLVDGTPCALGRKLEAVDERHSGSWRKRAFEADHPKPVAPVAEVPGTHLLSVKVTHVGVCLAVLAGFVAELAQVRASCHLEQFGFSARGL
jgi:hypothetical protein